MILLNFPHLFLFEEEKKMKNKTWRKLFGSSKKNRNNANSKHLRTWLGYYCFSVRRLLVLHSSAASTDTLLFIFTALRNKAVSLPPSPSLSLSSVLFFVCGLLLVRLGLSPLLPRLLLRGFCSVRL